MLTIANNLRGSICYNESMLVKIKRFLTTSWGAFLIGGLIGLVFFACFYGLGVINPFNTDWIWHSVTHDTAQHFIGWEFFRADSTGGIISGLAYPHGLAITFMDSIPLLAFIFKPLAGMLPANFQYFGLWAVACYILMGGLSAVLVRRIWLRIFHHSKTQSSGWQILFVAAASLIFVLSPMVMARTLYHPALAGQWLILWTFIFIWDAPTRYQRDWKFALERSLILVLAVLIHPYFIPMLGAMMLIALIRSWRHVSGWYANLKQFVIKGVIPVIATGIAFYFVGGFSMGTGSEVHDLEEKGFNLLSFINPSGYSVMPGFPNKSSSPETMMWLGLGVVMMVVIAAILWIGNYRQSFTNLRNKFGQHKIANWLMVGAGVCLLIFAMGVRIDAGPITLLQYSVPDKIYEIWSAFRAAAREAWPFYYAIVLLIIYWFGLAIRRQLTAKDAESKHIAMMIAIAMAVMSGVQLADICLSSNATAKHNGFTAINAPVEFKAIDLDGIYRQQKHLIALDDSFRGDQGGTYKIAQTALKYNMTLNTGFFARVQDEIKQEQADWRQRVSDAKLTDNDRRQYLFFTKDETLVNKVKDKYSIVKRGDLWFIY